MSLCAIPLIDPSIKHVGVSKLRDLNATKLAESQDTLVIQDNDKPLAVLLSYEKYLIIQEHLASVVSTIEMFSEHSELEGVLAGLRDVAGGRTRSFAEIKESLRNKYGKAAKEK